MHAFAGGLKLTKDGIGGVASGLGKGLHAVGSAVEHGLKPGDQHKRDDTPAQGSHDPAKDGTAGTAPGLGAGLDGGAVEHGPTPGDTPEQGKQDAPAPAPAPPTAPAAQAAPPTAPAAQAAPPTTSPSAAAPASSDPPPKSETPVGARSSVLGFLGNTLTSTSSALLSAPASVVSVATTGASLALHTTHDVAATGLSIGTSVATSGASLALHATHGVAATGLSIGTSVAHAGLDAGADVVSLATGTASLAGTALGGVVKAAAETSGAVFEPVGSGLKTLKALEGLGVETVNGLSVGAVKKVNELTTKALNMKGKTPTFFDPDADGIILVPDTVRGLMLLGLPAKIATYAAYALHTAFSYSTSDSWIPALGTSLPIRVSKMGGTRWGKNWGNFERVDWVSDVEIDKFFAPQKIGLFGYWKLGRQGFGVLLLIFEWGTTWPFYMPSLTVPKIPFASDIGSVVRKAILPTIVSNFKTASALNAQPQAQKPAEAPGDSINMPGQFTG